MLKNLSENKNSLEGLYSKRIALKEEIELYKNWIKEITNEFGRANNGKAQEKKQLQTEIKRVESLIADIDSILDSSALTFLEFLALAIK
jgi:transposase